MPKIRRRRINALVNKSQDSNQKVISQTQNSLGNQQVSTAVPDSTVSSNESDSDIDVITKRISTHNSCRNRLATSSNSAGPSNDSDVSDVDVIPQRTRILTPNSHRNKQVSRSFADSTMPSNESDSDIEDTDSSRQQAIPRASQHMSEQNVSNEENISGYSSETPDSDGIPVHDRNLTKKKKNTTARKILPMARMRKDLSDFSEEEVVGSSQSKGQGHQTKSGSKAPLEKTKIDSVDLSTLKNLAQKCVYFLLVEDHKKHAIRKKSIIANVFKDEAYSSKVYNSVLKEANSMLKETYGLELIQLENQKDSYIIINILERELGVEDFYDFSISKQQQYGLILFLLTTIFMNENSISEADLWKALKPLGIDPSCKVFHPVFGDVKRYITSELVKQMYLDFKIINNETGEREFFWGVRAKAEVDKRDLLEFACEVLGVSSLKAFVTQYKDSQELVEEANNNNNEV